MEKVNDESLGIINDRLGSIVETAKQAIEIEHLVINKSNDLFILSKVKELVCERVLAAKFSCCDTYFSFCRTFSKYYSEISDHHLPTLNEALDTIILLENKIILDGYNKKSISKFNKVLSSICGANPHSHPHVGELAERLKLLNLSIELEINSENIDKLLQKIRCGGHSINYFVSATTEAINEKKEKIGIDHNWNPLFEILINERSIEDTENKPAFEERIETLIKVYKIPKIS